MRTRLMLLSLCLGTLSLLAGGSGAAERLSTQSTSGSGVTVKATPRALAGGSWEFDVALESHSQELKDELVNSASLVADGKAHSPAGWKGDPPGGHHRKGVLRFDAVDPSPKELELRIARPGEAKARSFRWQPGK